MSKEELIKKLEELEELPYYNDSKFKLLKKLIMGTNEEDPDFKKALNDNMVIQIVNLYCECYTKEELIDILAKMDFDVFCNYRFAEAYSLEDYSMEEIKEVCFYNGEFDGLMCNEEKTIFVKCW